jgi:hypothetical protein
MHPLLSSNPLRLSSCDIYIFFQFQEPTGGWYDFDQSVWGGSSCRDPLVALTRPTVAS